MSVRPKHLLRAIFCASGGRTFCGESPRSVVADEYFCMLTEKTSGRKLGAIPTMTATGRLPQRRLHTILVVMRGIEYADRFGKLHRNFLRNRETIELTDALGYFIIWQRRREVR